MGCFDIETNNLPFLQTVFVKVKIKFKKKDKWICGCGRGDEKLWKLFQSTLNKKQKTKDAKLCMFFFLFSPLLILKCTFCIISPFLTPSLCFFLFILFLQFCMLCMIYNQTTFLPHVFIQHSLFSVMSVCEWLRERIGVREGERERTVGQKAVKVVEGYYNNNNK